MKRKLFLLWVLFASIAFCVLFSEAKLIPLVISLVFGIIAGLMIIRLCPDYRFRDTSIPVLLVCIVLDIIIIWNCAPIPFYSWNQSAAVHRILSIFTSDTGRLLRAVGVGLAVFSFPFIHIVTSTVVSVIINSVKSVNWKGICTVRRFSGRSFLKTAGICLSNIVIAALLGLLLLTAVYKLPLNNIMGNVKKSAVTMNNEGTYPTVFSWCFSQLDNFTDSIMLTEAADDTNESAFHKALMVYHGTYKSPVEALVQHFLYGEEYLDTVGYPRYWHGYLIFLKPLLEIMDYSAIRVVNGITQLVLLLIICGLMIKRNLKQFVFPYIICYLMLMPVALAMNLEFSACYYTISAGILSLLLLPDDKRNRYSWLVFLNIGILTAFFDYLTYPIATFGVPAVLLIALSTRNETELKLRRMIENGIAWCVGFGGMWVSKWILTAMFTDYDIFKDAFSAVSGRVSLVADDGETKIAVLDCIRLNYQVFFRTPFALLILALVLYLVFFICKNRKSDLSLSRRMVPYIVLSLAPVVWYCFATNHSMVHCFFTNKCCVVSVAAILFGLTECFITANKSKKTLN